MGIRLADDHWQLLGHVGSVAMLLVFVLPGLLELVGMLGFAAVPTVVVGSVEHSVLTGVAILVFGVGYWRSEALDGERPVYLGAPPPAERRDAAEEDGFLEAAPRRAEDDRAPAGTPADPDGWGSTDRSASLDDAERASEGSPEDPAVERN